MNSHTLFAIVFVVLRCFLAKTNAEFRVLNGEYVLSREKSPHTVAILNPSEYICGGTLISMASVITDAKCVHPFREANLKVMAGVNNLKEISDYRQEREVCAVKFINGYEEGLVSIAVVKVYPEFKRVDNFVTHATVCHKDTKLTSTKEMYVFGWGMLTYITGASMTIRGKDICMSRYRTNKPSFVAQVEQDTAICIGDKGCWLSSQDAGAGAFVNEELCAVAYPVDGKHNLPNLFTDLRNAKVRSFMGID